VPFLTITINVVAADIDTLSFTVPYAVCDYDM